MTGCVSGRKTLVNSSTRRRSNTAMRPRIAAPACQV
jgi:hypothetical protein